MTTIAVVGLGYVGLPLAVEFGKKFRTIGFDLSVEKIESYKRFIDPTGEVSSEDLKAATMLEVGTNPAALKEADFVIVAVPTPVDDAHQPDFSPLVGSSKAVGQNLKQGAPSLFLNRLFIPVQPRKSAFRSSNANRARPGRKISSSVIRRSALIRATKSGQ
jgi:UDP-N-acetyl-D-galactosamine dehydrogenase